MCFPVSLIILIPWSLPRDIQVTLNKMQIPKKKPSYSDKNEKAGGESEVGVSPPEPRSR